MKGTECSTPFGITAVNTGLARRRRERRQQCSTPFGITAVNTCRRSLFSRADTCAQRLSASLRSTPARSDSSRCRTACAQRLSASLRSTPRMPSRPGPSPPVLNAFRHHCGQHPAGHRPAPRLRSVLNAFRHHCGQHNSEKSFFHLPAPCSTPFGITAVNTLPCRSRTWSASRAQRLSASLRSTLHPPGHQGHAHRVLNAFRHHCGQHVRKTGQTARSAAVLNAFRHHCGQHVIVCPPWPVAPRAQRLSASLRSTQRPPHRRGPLNRMCSTPFGITAVNTCGQRTHHSHSGRVLNAFRHHCGQHVRAIELSPSSRSCSTPFGITAVNTDREVPVYADGTTGAQRLSASLRSTHGGRR